MLPVLRGPFTGGSMCMGAESAEKMLRPEPAYWTCSARRSLSRWTVGSRPALETDESFSASWAEEEAVAGWPDMVWGSDRGVATGMGCGGVGELKKLS